MSEHEDTVHDGTIIQRCSKCKMPCKGRVGPTGSSCSIMSMATTEDTDIITEQVPIEVQDIHEPEGAEAIHNGRLSEHLLNTLVTQMAMMNTNFQTMIECQISLTHAVEWSITSSPPIATGRGKSIRENRKGSHRFINRVYKSRRIPSVV